jgi:prepilin-type N-terminal cleavage/methylation domain-containing protein
MKHSSTISSLRHRAFTLIELLVVIAIIGVLAGLIFPAATAVQKNAEKVTATNTCYNIKNAISTYYTEYRKFPVESGTEETDELRTDIDLMSALMASDASKEKGGLNPRGISFYTDKAAKATGDSEYPWRKGIRMDADGSGELYDPYGDFYYVRLDLDSNSRVEKPTWDVSEGEVISESIIVWSAGKDHDEELPKDNIKTW